MNLIKLKTSLASEPHLLYVAHLEGVYNSERACVLHSSTFPKGFCCLEETTHSFIPLPGTGLGT